MTREEIITAVRREHNKFLAAIAGVAADAMSTQAIVEGWTMKDMLGHIATWYRVAENFLREYQREGAPQSLGLNDDAAVNVYNQRAADARRDWSIARIRAEFEAAFHALVGETEKLSAAQLNAQLPPPWEAGVTLERLIAWNAYEHVPEHTEQVWKHSKKTA